MIRTSAIQLDCTHLVQVLLHANSDLSQPKPSAYPSDSASTKTSSPSSPVPDSEVVDKLPVEVVTIGTDWEACSEASAEVLSVNTDTGIGVEGENRV